MRRQSNPELAAVNTTDMMAFLDRVEKLEEEKSAISGDIKEVWSEAKAAGYSVKHLRKAHALRKLTTQDRAQLGVYVNALQLFEE